MTEIADLQRRLRDALDRIANGVDGLEPPRREPPVDPVAVTRLEEALAAEKEANAQLEERLRALREKMEHTEREQRSTIDRLQQDLADGELQAQRMRRTNTQLRQSIQALREAAESGVVAPEQINQALVAELDGMRSARDNDRAEMDTILAELKPMLEEGQNA